MFEVIVDELKYIEDVPNELTKAAVDAGELRKGAVVGLIVHTPSDQDNRILVEVKLSDDGQEGLLKNGLCVPLEGQGIRYRFAPSWYEYLSNNSFKDNMKGLDREGSKPDEKLHIPTASTPNAMTATAPDDINDNANNPACDDAVDDVSNTTHNKS